MVIIIIIIVIASQKILSECLSQMSKIDEEERISIQQRLVREHGFTGLSVLHRLHCINLTSWKTL